ncbi:MAG: hypothetical protein P4L56_19155 [Candidatus Sulfopaludibacter sp.]|nr:hypothetical protein [Candidatus Sulfopaludibacter sp.]
MKRLLCLLLCSGALACAGDLSTAKTVYVLSMPRGMDQYLANRLTNSHILQVVTDPKKADAFITDRVGDAFQAQMDVIFPPPEPVDDTADADDKADARKPVAAKAGTDKAGTDKTGTAKVANKGAQSSANPVPMFGPTVNKLSNPALVSTFARNKGTIFLVDAQSREVLWSVYDPPKSFDSKDLDRTASDIVSRLKKDLKK